MVKPKCVSRVADFLEFSAACLQFQKTNPPPLKHVLVYTTKGPGGIIIELQLFEIVENFLTVPHSQGGENVTFTKFWTKMREREFP